jgi:hypothetical protein
VLPAADFRPQRIFFPNIGVNRRVCLCDVESYVSAQTLAFLDIGKNPASWSGNLRPTRKGLFGPGRPVVAGFSGCGVPVYASPENPCAALARTENPLFWKQTLTRPEANKGYLGIDDLV